MGRRNFGLRHKQPLDDDDRTDPSKRRFILHATKMSASQDLFRCRRRRRRYALYRFPRETIHSIIAFLIMIVTCSFLVFIFRRSFSTHTTVPGCRVRSERTFRMATSGRGRRLGDIETACMLQTRDYVF